MTLRYRRKKPGGGIQLSKYFPLYNGPNTLVGVYRCEWSFGLSSVLRRIGELQSNGTNANMTDIERKCMSIHHEGLKDQFTVTTRKGVRVKNLLGKERK